MLHLIDHYQNALEQVFTVHKLTGGKITRVRRNARYLSMRLRLFNSRDLGPARELGEELAYAANTPMVRISREQGLLVYQFELPPKYHQVYWISDMPTPDTIGLAESGPIKFDFDYPHTLVAGITGSGKTELITTILYTLMNRFKPSELGVIVADLSDNFFRFASSPHLLGPIYTGQVAGKALQEAYAVFRFRVNNNLKSEKPMLVALDESHFLLAGKKSQELAQEMVRLGRQYKVYLLIGVQKATQTGLPNILDQLERRYVGRVDNARNSALMTGHPGMGCQRLAGQGDFIRIQVDVERFQVARTQPHLITELANRGNGGVRVEEAAPKTILPIELPVVEEPKPGRPRIQLDPALVARYIFLHPLKVSEQAARQYWGLKRVGHIKHRDFALAVSRELLRLKQLQQASLRSTV